jgi:hypothetical protein
LLIAQRFALCRFVDSVCLIFRCRNDAPHHLNRLMSFARFLEIPGNRRESEENSQQSAASD